MNRTLLRSMGLAGVICVSITMSNCKLDPFVLPDGVHIRGQNTGDNSGIKLTVETVNTNLVSPGRICYDNQGNLFVSSAEINQVYKISPNGKTSIILRDRLSPSGLKTDIEGNVIVALAGENKVVKISPSGKVTDLDVGMDLNQPSDVAISNDGTIYIADTRNNRVLKLNKQGATTVFAGKTGVFGIRDGKAAEAHFSYPTALRLSSDGVLWVADGNGVNKALKGQTIRRISLAGNVSTVYTQVDKKVSIVDFATARRDKFFTITDEVNLYLLKTDNGIYHYQINKAETQLNDDLSPGFTDGSITKAQFYAPSGICIKGDELFITDKGNNKIRKVGKSQ